MPKIYSEEKRREITDKLLDTSLELVRQYGLGKLRIEDITKRVGIALGTFYSFFPSKEMLVYALAGRYQARLDARADAAFNLKGYLDRADLRALYYDMMLSDDDNVLRFLSRNDIEVLTARLPKSCLVSFADAGAAIAGRLEKVKNRRAEVDVGAVINWIQLMNLTVQNKDLLVKSGLEKIIRGLIENMLGEIFEEEAL